MVYHPTLLQTEAIPIKHLYQISAHRSTAAAETPRRRWGNQTTLTFQWPCNQTHRLMTARIVAIWSTSHSVIQSHRHDKTVSFSYEPFKYPIWDVCISILTVKLHIYFLCYIICLTNQAGQWWLLPQPLADWTVDLELLQGPTFSRHSLQIRVTDRRAPAPVVWPWYHSCTW